MQKNDLHDYFLFPSPVSVLNCGAYEDVSKNLVKYIYNLKNTHNRQANENRSSIGGWQSKTDLLNDPEFANFQEYIISHIEEITSRYDCIFLLDSLWANINPRGGYNLSHLHPGSDLSGVLFVQTSLGCGNLVFENRNLFLEFNLLQNMNLHLKKQSNYCPNFQIQPIPGRLVIFPSSVPHFVETNCSNEDRISISFNLKIG